MFWEASVIEADIKRGREVLLQRQILALLLELATINVEPIIQHD